MLNTTSDNEAILQQDYFLTHLIKEKYIVSIYLINGIKLQGQLAGFDSQTIFLTTASANPKLPMQMIFKQAISTIGT